MCVRIVQKKIGFRFNTFNTLELVLMVMGREVDVVFGGQRRDIKLNQVCFVFIACAVLYL